MLCSCYAIPVIESTPFAWKDPSSLATPNQVGKEWAHAYLWYSVPTPSLPEGATADIRWVVFLYSAWVASEEDAEGFLASLNRKAMALSNLTLDTAELLQVREPLEKIASE